MTVFACFRFNINFIDFIGDGNKFDGNKKGNLVIAPSFRESVLNRNASDFSDSYEAEKPMEM